MGQIKVVLVGGPTYLDDGDRIRYVAGGTGRIKVPSGNGYEHFSATEELLTVGDTELPVFTWVGRTKLAE